MLVKEEASGNVRLKKVLFVFGTRPEAVKMAPVISELKKRRNVELKICVSGQHRELLDGVLDVFEIKPDFDLNVMKHGQTLNDITCAVISGLSRVLAEFCADLVAVHGDTTTAFVAALTAYYQKIKVAHVEAGLRTNDIYSPFPEEGNRKMIDAISSLLFAPTPRSRETLLAENIDENKIFVVGNSVVDALSYMREKINSSASLQKNIVQNIKNAGFVFDEKRRYVLLTTHRRENIGDNLAQIYEAVKTLAKTYETVDFIVVLHPNPALAKIIEPIVAGVKNVKILRNVDYYSFTYLMSKAYAIMTDSGGIQEEAPSFGVPVFVLRNETERPEGVEAGVAKILGADTNFIVCEMAKILENPDLRNAMSAKDGENPYGDGKTSERIAKIIESA